MLYYESSFTYAGGVANRIDGTVEVSDAIEELNMTFGVCLCDSTLVVVGVVFVFC
jgi:hypothetical protein